MYSALLVKLRRNVNQAKLKLKHAIKSYILISILGIFLWCSKVTVTTNKFHPSTFLTHAMSSSSHCIRVELCLLFYAVGLEVGQKYANNVIYLSLIQYYVCVSEDSWMKFDVKLDIMMMTYLFDKLVT